MVVLYLLLAYLFTTFFGYVVHKAFHKPWMGRAYKAHMNHHLKQYPPNDFYSDKYRSAGKDNTVYLFILAFLPILFTIKLLMYLSILTAPVGVAMLAVMIGVGLLHNYIHDAFHLNKTFLRKFKFFKRLEKLHYIHHIDMRKNLGIYTFIWDKVFKTFRNK